MLDPSGMYPEGFHPIQINRRRNFRGAAKRYTRTSRPTKYYLIDFGSSRRYSSRNALDQPIRGSDKSAPEHRLGNLCNPFHTDIYYLGNVVRERFFKVRQSVQTLVGYVAYAIYQLHKGFEFMVGLVDAMTDENPAERPTIEDVISRFCYVRDSLSVAKLRSPITSKKDPSLVITYRHARQMVRTAGYVVQAQGLPNPGNPPRNPSSYAVTPPARSPHNKDTRERENDRRSAPTAVSILNALNPEFLPPLPNLDVSRPIRDDDTVVYAPSEGSIREEKKERGDFWSWATTGDRDKEDGQQDLMRMIGIYTALPCCLSSFLILST
jgi:serine/threonine protein kinase